MNKYIYLFLISMVPLIELRGGMLVATAPAAGYDFLPALLICILGNMLPVPFIYFFARKVLIWGADKKIIGKVFTFCLVKGEKTGNKLAHKAGRKGLFIAVLLFVGIPLPGTGAWTGTLGASFLKIGFKSTVLAVSLGVILAGLLVGFFGTAIFSIF